MHVVEVMSRSKQGATQPYVCRCDDGQVWFVKGRSANRIGLIKEWLCANLAHSFGLPIAPFAIAEVPQELIEADMVGMLRDLGPGPVFASCKVLGQELAAIQVPKIPLALRQDVLVFDWWIRNGDRNLTAKGGNVNLLWQAGKLNRTKSRAKAVRQGEITLIDHNLALDAEFSPVDFCQSHVFAADLPKTFSDFLLRHTFIDRLRQALQVWDSAWNNVPPAWAFIDDEQTISSNYPQTEARAILNLIDSPEFWNLPP